MTDRKIVQWLKVYQCPCGDPGCGEDGDVEDATEQITALLKERDKSKGRVASGCRVCKGVQHENECPAKEYFTQSQEAMRRMHEALLEAAEPCGKHGDTVYCADVDECGTCLRAQETDVAIGSPEIE